jgi:uncharacterized protein HemX
VSAREIGGVVLVLLPLLGIGKVVELFVIRQINRATEARKARREDRDEEQQEEGYFERRSMTLEAELQKRDARIATLEAEVGTLKQEMHDLRAEMADVLIENRQMRRRMEAQEQASPGG